jgi:hypothetical protein
MPFDSGDGEMLARFIVQKNHVRADLSLRHDPFVPSKKTGQLSVYAIANLGEADIWSIGKKHVADVIQKPLYGRADFNSLRVYEAGLKVESAPIPHPRHANIVGWDLESTAPRAQALKLAAEAIFRPAPAV